MMVKQKFIPPCMAILAFALLAMSWSVPVNSSTPETTGGIHAQGNGYMTSTSTLVDSSYVSAARGAKGYYTVSGNSCEIDMEVYVYSSQDYSLYSSGQNVTPYRMFRTYASRKWSFIAPASDTWYFVYRPATTFSGSIYVYSYVQADTSGPVISTNLQNLLNINSSFTIQANATDLFQVSYIGIEINGDPKAEAFNSTTISYIWTPDPNYQQMNTVRLTSWDQFDQVSSCQYYIIGADRTPPVVTWNSHPTTVSGSSVYLYISYSDNVALKRFRILVNGSQLYDKEYSSSSSYTTSDSTNYCWNTLSVANGNATLTAIAWDLKGLNKTSSIKVKVDNDRTPPSISWVSIPTTVNGSSVPIVVSVSDDHQVNWVELWVDGYACYYVYPYSQSAMVIFHFDSQSYSNGQISLEAIASDSAGNTNTITRYVTINNDCTYPSASWQSTTSDVSGTVDIPVMVSDNVAIGWVAFYAETYDLVSNISRPVNNAVVHFTLDTTQFSNGYLNLRVIVCDTSGLKTYISEDVYVNNDGSSTTTTYSADSTAYFAILGVFLIIFSIVIIGVIAVKANKKNGTASNMSFRTSSTTSYASRSAIPVRSITSNRPSTTSSTSSRSSTISSTNNRSSTISSTNNRSSTISSTSSRPSMASTINSRSSTASTTISHPASRTLVRSNLPASCFVPTIKSAPCTSSGTRAKSSAGTSASISNRAQAKPRSRPRAQPRVSTSTPVDATKRDHGTSGSTGPIRDVVEGIRTLVPAPAASKPAPRPRKNSKARVTSRLNAGIFPKTSRMYVDGACFNDVAPGNDATSNGAAISMPMLFCKTCNVPVVPDSTNSGTAATCKTCGSVLMHLVPIAAIARPKSKHVDAEREAFMKVLSWMLAKKAMPASGRIRKARLKNLLKYTGNGDLSVRRLIQKMLKAGLFVAETEKTVVLAKKIVDCTSLDDLLAYLVGNMRNM